MYLYKTTTFPHQPLKSISKVAVLHRFYCTDNSLLFSLYAVGSHEKPPHQGTSEETMCMICQSLFSGENEKNVFLIFPRKIGFDISST